MNNFTKEELEDIYELVKDVCKEYRAVDDNDTDLDDYWIPLKNKLQSIIDNYDAQVIKVWHCEKCGHVQ